MNSILSIFLALTMLIASVGAQGPVYFEAAINVNPDAITQVMETTQGLTGQVPGASGAPEAAKPDAENPEQGVENARKIVEILNAVKLKGIADQGAGELQLVVADQPVLTAGVKAAEAGTILASSLLTPYTLVASPEALKAAAEGLGNSISQQQTSNVDMQALMAAVQKIDPEQLMKDIDAFTRKIQTGFKIGEPENGEYTVDGMNFTVKTTVDMTYEEIMELLLGSLKDLLNSESLKEVVQALAKDKDLNAEIDKSLEKLKNTPEDQRPEMTAAAYNSGTEAPYYVLDMVTKTVAGETIKSQKNHIGLGQIEGASLIAFDMDNGASQTQIRTVTKDGNLEMNAQIASNDQNAVISGTRDAEGNAEITADIVNKQVTAKIHETETVKEDGRDYLIEIHMNGSADPVLTITATSGKGGELVSVFEDETLKPIDVGTLQNGAQAQETTRTLTMTVSANLLKAVVALSKSLPEEAGQWLLTQVQGMIMSTMKR